MKKTKIVCTIGPASENKEVLTSLVKAGMNVMRLNFSHGDHEEHFGKVKTLREINAELGTNVAFLLDTKGPEIRTGSFGADQNTRMSFTKGDKITLTTKEVEGTKDLLYVNYAGLPQDVEVGGHILIDDGLVDLLIDEIDGTEIKCTFQNSAVLKGRRGVNVPGAKLQLKAMTEKDKSDLKFAVENDFDFVAASFIRKPEDVIEMKKYLDSCGEHHIKIISKIENQEGLDNFDEILKVTDGIMVARGDLGVEIPEENVPAAQKMMIKKTVAAGKPVITATQMLESMQRNPRPTRAEVSDVANAIYDGTSAIMLSGESAQGDYPLNCVETMTRIAVATENDINYWKRFKKANLEKACACEARESDLKTKANFSVCCSALFSEANAVVAVSEDGDTASILSSFRIGCPIYVITPSVAAYRSMAVEQNVTPVLVKGETDFNTILNKGIEVLKEKEYLKANDTIVLSGGFLNGTSLQDQITGKIVRV
ncbi:MAG: pyruvate kinase [Clostridia bacterium]|nr:pyruvate kinase [Clostridia bacterium]